MASLAVLIFWALGQGYIFTFGHIASAIRDVWKMRSDGPYADVARGAAALIRQHRNGLIHAAGVVILELALSSSHGRQLGLDPKIWRSSPVVFKKRTRFAIEIMSAKTQAPLLMSATGLSFGKQRWA